jgi:hypothetical protein
MKGVHRIDLASKMSPIPLAAQGKLRSGTLADESGPFASGFCAGRGKCRFTLRAARPAYCA